MNMMRLAANEPQRGRQRIVCVGKRVRVGDRDLQKRPIYMTIEL